MAKKQNQDLKEREKTRAKQTGAMKKMSNSLQKEQYKLYLP